MELIKSAGFATRQNAIKKLVNEGVDLDNDRWLIANNETGRFVPVLVGAEYVSYVFRDITVVG